MKVSLDCFSVFIPCKLYNIQNLFCQFVVTNFSKKKKKKNCLVEKKSDQVANTYLKEILSDTQFYLELRF